MKEGGIDGIRHLRLCAPRSEGSVWTLFLKRKGAKARRRKEKSSSKGNPLSFAAGAGILRRVMTENEISRIIIDAAIEVHRELGGSGLLEDVYEEAMEAELLLRGLSVERQLPVRIVYKGKVLRKPLRLDMRVEKIVLIDNKAVSEWHPVFEAQMLTYLRLTGLKLGLAINFGGRYLRDGVRRVVNGL